MATQDMITELEAGVTLDPLLERRVCESVLNQLDDLNADVQSVAIKCIGVLTKVVQEGQICEIVEGLAHHLLSNNIKQKNLTDIYSIGLSCVVKGVPQQMGSLLAKRLAPRLLDGISTDRSESQEIRSECLEVFKQLLTRFGAECIDFHENTMGVLLTQIGNDKSVIQKRAVAALGVLAPYLIDHLLTRLATTLLQRIESPSSGSGEQSVRIYIQAIGRISRTVGHRLGHSIDRIIPLFLKYLGDPTDEDESLQSEQICELRETILHAFESFAERCPHQIAAHMEEMLGTVIGFMAYDPNYTYDDMDEDEEMGGSDDDMGGSDADDNDYEDYDDEDYGDEDDNTWKVRRASVKVIQACFHSRPELLEQLYNQCTDSLIGRLKEREESVKTAVILCLEELMIVTTQQNQNVVTELLRDRTGVIVNSIAKLLKDKKLSVKIKTLLFTLLIQFLLAVQGSNGNNNGTGISNYLDALVPVLSNCLRDRNGGMKLQVLTFIQTLVETHRTDVVRPYVASLLPAVIACGREDWYKIIAQSLRVVGCFVDVLRPLCRDGGGRNMLADYNGDVDELLGKMFDVTSERLSQNDIDQEIKECAVSTMGGIMAHFADVSCLSQRISSDIWSLLQTRLTNEVTRIATLNALRRIAESPLNTSLGSEYLQNTVACLASFMRQQMRTLKLTTLVTTDAVVQKWGRDISNDGYFSLIQHVGGLIHERDLHMSHLALQVAVSCLSCNKNQSSTIQQHVLQPSLSLACSSLLQEGPTLNSLLLLLQSIVSDPKTTITPDELRGMLIQPIEKQGNVPRQTILCVSKCVATVCVGTTGNDQTSTIDIFLNTVRTHQQSQGNVSGGDISVSTEEKVSIQLALHCIGEIGSILDLSNHNGLTNIVLDAIRSKTDEIRSAAAFCLGSMSIGNMNTFVPQVLSALGNSGNSQYQLLTSIKEMVSRHILNRKLNFGPYMSKVLPVLQNSAVHKEEAVRNMVAECFGELASLDPNVVLPRLQEMTKSNNADARWTAMSSLKYAVANPDTFSGLSQTISSYLSLLNDNDLNVKRASLLSLNAIIHHQSALIREHLNSFINVLYESTKIELVRVIDLGPFKHKVDDGLPLRKAAFSCMDSLLDELNNYVDIKAFIPTVVIGLTDKNVDVKMLNHQLICKLCKLAPSDVMGSLSEILPILDKAVTKNVKTADVGTQEERRNDGKLSPTFFNVYYIF
jgi:cullin-associated NEDD8-dissociated protein 1